MRVRIECVLALLLCLAAAGVAWAADGETFTDPAKAGPDFAVQGEYKGDLQLDGKPTPMGVQVIAEGDGNFEAVVYTGGLPGAGWKRGDGREKVKGKTEGGTTNFKSDKWLAAIADGKMSFTNSGNDKLGTLEKTERKSPTLGAKPPAGAVVLFDGTNTDHFPGAKMSDDHLLLAGAMSKDFAPSSQSMNSYATACLMGWMTSGSRCSTKPRLSPTKRCTRRRLRCKRLDSKGKVKARKDL